MIPKKPLNEFTQEELLECSAAFNNLITSTRDLIDSIYGADDDVLGLMNLSFEFTSKGVSLIDFINRSFDNLEDFMRTKAAIDHELSERQ